MEAMLCFIMSEVAWFVHANQSNREIVEYGSDGAPSFLTQWQTEAVLCQVSRFINLRPPPIATPFGPLMIEVDAVNFKTTTYSRLRTISKIRLCALNRRLRRKGVSQHPSYICTLSRQSPSAHNIYPHCQRIRGFMLIHATRVYTI